jgi:hypothetical protein
MGMLFDRSRNGSHNPQATIEIADFSRPRRCWRHGGGGLLPLIRAGPARPRIKKVLYFSGNCEPLHRAEGRNRQKSMQRMMIIRAR